MATETRTGTANEAESEDESTSSDHSGSEDENTDDEKASSQEQDPADQAPEPEQEVLSARAARRIKGAHQVRKLSTGIYSLQAKLGEALGASPELLSPVSIPEKEEVFRLVSEVIGSEY